MDNVNIEIGSKNDTYVIDDYITEEEYNPELKKS